MLEPALRAQAEQKPHLWSYLEALPLDTIGPPAYHETLGRKLRDLKNPNLIYPVGQGLFVHICPDPEDSRDVYVALEPGMGEDLDELIAAVESRLLDLVEELEKLDSAASRKEILLRAIGRVCTTRSRPNWMGNAGKIRVTTAQLMALSYRLIRDKEGMGVLQPLLQDPNIEDISCSGLGELFVEHKIFGSLKSNIRFDDHADLDRFVVGLSEKIGRPVTYRQPIVDATLRDGSRINIVFGGEVSKRGSNFTIRKFAGTPMSVLDLIETGSLNYQMAAYLSLVMGEGMSMFVSGETASGKTTLLNAITTFLSPSNKIVSIEDTPELQVPHPNWTREVVRGAKDGNASVTMFDLLRAALRQRPNQIIIGEIRGEEGLIAFQAMQTGHPCLATFHAASVEKLIQRLTGNPISVPKTYVDNLNVVVIQSAVRLPDGRSARRVISVSELIGYDSASDSFSFVEVFRWNPVEDTFEFTGNMNSYLLEYKIAPKRGIPPHRKRQIYDELERRSRILQALHGKGVTDFNALYRVLSKAYRDGLIR
jgi:archaeal flagellar protein FlaI